MGVSRDGPLVTHTTMAFSHVPPPFVSGGRSVYTFPLFPRKISPTSPPWMSVIRVGRKKTRDKGTHGGLLSVLSKVRIDQGEV